MTKAEREKLALEKREAEINAQKKKEEEEARKREDFERKSAPRLTMHRSLRLVPTGARLSPSLSSSASSSSSSLRSSSLRSSYSTSAASSSPLYLRARTRATATATRSAGFHTSTYRLEPVPSKARNAQHADEIKPVATGLQKWSKYLPKVRAGRSFFLLRWRAEEQRNGGDEGGEESGRAAEDC